MRFKGCLQAFLSAALAGLGIGFIVVLVILATNGTEDNGDDDTSSADAADACVFVPMPGELVVYQAPVSDPMLQQFTLPGDSDYPVSSQKGQHYFLEVDDERSGWVDKEAGSLTGDCEDLPFDDTPLTAFDSLCTYTTEVTVLVYAELTLATPLETYPPSIYPVTRFNAGSYYLHFDRATGGWFAPVDGVLAGNCDTLPT